MKIETSWPNVVTISCIVVVAIIEAWQQAIVGTAGIHPRLEGLWHFAPIALLILAGISWLIGRKKNHHVSQQQGSTAQTTATATALTPAGPCPIDVERFFRTAYSGQLQAEMEGNVRATIQSRLPTERDEFVVRFIATGIINALYENIWLTIYRSQVLVLTELNRKLLRREQVKTYYDVAAQSDPAVYANYSFDQWLGYLRSQLLLLEHPGQTFEITVRGKDFLKYMVHCGYTADARKF